VNLLQRIALLTLMVLFLGLTTGVELYSVHCNMRGETFVSLQSGMDPCLIEMDNSASESCCAAKSHCASNTNQSDNDGCCDEEEIHLSYEPDSFSQFKINLPSFVFLDFSPFYFFDAEFFIQEEQLLAQFPQPPPLRGRQILEFHCIWRI
jgi:hypothetical protein